MTNLLNTVLSPISRRAFIGGTLASAVLAHVPAAAVGVPLQGGKGGVLQASPAGWRTWLLSAPDELRPPRPDAVSPDEIMEVLSFQTDPSDAMTAAIAAWGSGPAGLGWFGQAADLLNEFTVAGMRQSRMMALIQTAVSDALLAAWDAQLAYGRKGPAASDERITAPAGVDLAAPTFPSSRAAAAGAATTVLAYLLPDAAPGRFEDLATQAAMADAWSGAAFPSDVTAGLAVGKAVGERAIQRGQTDGSQIAWDPSTQPTGAGFWVPTPPKHLPPLEPLGGTWKLWVLERNDELRPAAPPDFGSRRWQAELAAVQDAVKHRTFQQESEARWRQSTGVFNSFGLWGTEQILRQGLSAPEAARVLAYAAVAVADAQTAVWDAKYTSGWWTERPITADPTLVTAFPTPPYPAYPSGYSAVAGAFATVLGAFFPDVATDFQNDAWLASMSRLWAGIHYPIDNEVGLAIGRQAGRLVATLASADGAQ